MSKDNEDNNVEDWYDNGSGSENFKRQIAAGELEFLKNQPLPAFLAPLCKKKIKTKKNGKNLNELIEALSEHLDADHKLSPYAHIPKGLLEEIVRSGRRLLRYVGELEGD
jgi:hypothetical protein